MVMRVKSLYPVVMKYVHGLLCGNFRKLICVWFAFVEYFAKKHDNISILRNSTLAITPIDVLP